MKIKFKIFFGTATGDHADTKLNRWLSENPNVRVIDYKYQQARMGDHSICITYTETNYETSVKEEDHWR